MRAPEISEIEELRNLLRGNAIKRIVLKKDSECSVGYIEYRDRVFEILFSRGDFADVYIAKILYRPSEYISCEYLVYNPYGLFVFSKDLRELAEKIVAKLEHAYRYSERISGEV